MKNFKRSYFLELPSELIIHVIGFLPFDDLFTLINAGDKRLRECSIIVMKQKQFKIAIIGGYGHGGNRNDVEVISIENDKISSINKSIPSLPQKLECLHGARLPNGDCLVCGGRTRFDNSDEYLLYKQSAKEWTKVGQMVIPRSLHASVCMNGCTYSCGGWDSFGNRCALHEVIDTDGVVREKKELPIILIDHTATKIDQNRFLIAGGWDENYKKSRCTFIYDIHSNNWTNGPSLISARFSHSSCAIQSQDGTTECIIIIGGITKEGLSNSTEIMKIKERKWVQGPNLPYGIKNAACVALPPTMNHACAVIGGEGENEEERFSSKVYGLDRSLSTWNLLGEIQNGRRDHIALSIS